MEMKNILSKILKKATETTVSSATASFCGYGIEEMPESIKENR